MIFLLALILMFLLILGVSIGIVYKLKNALKEVISKKNVLIIILILFSICMGIGLIVDFMDFVVIYMHLLLFWLLMDLIIYVIKKITKIKVKKYVSLLVAVVISTIYLTYAYKQAINVVRTDYTLYTSKSIEDFRIVQISDSHLGNTIDGDSFLKYIDEINSINPDIVVVTGDFIDDDTSYNDMLKGCIGLGKLNAKYGVYFIYGNHDASYFNYRKYTKEDIVNNLRKNNVIILEDEIYNVNDDIILVGRNDKRFTDRKSISELTQDLDKNSYIIVLDHQPNDYKNEANSGVDLVLSGHTHGGQLFPLGPLSMLFNINDNVYGLKKINNTNFIVNSGLGDWAIKFKSFTKSEYVVIDIKGE